MPCRKYTIKNTIVRVGSHMRMRVMDAAKCLEFCPRENIFFSESDWSFLRTKRSFPSDKILA